MEKIYVLCYLFANELENIRVCTNLETALKMFEKAKKSKQVLEYNVVDGITEEQPVCVYYYDGDTLLKQRTK
jgi:hypothetical protein